MNKSEMAHSLAGSKNRTLMDMSSQIEVFQSNLDRLPAQMTEQITQVLAPTLAQMEGLQSSLDQLPPAVTEQLMEVIGPLTALPSQVQKALDSFDAITQAQRDTLMDIAEETTRQTVSLLDARATELDATIKQAGESTAQMSTHFASAATTVAGLSKVLASMDGTSIQMRESLTTLTDAAKDKHSAVLIEMQKILGSLQKAEKARLASQPPKWKMPAIMLACALAGATGVDISNRFLPPVSVQVPSEIQTQATYATNLWSKATPAEQKLLMAIVNRRAK